MPGAALGLQAEDPTIAELLKPSGYVTGQFGKKRMATIDEEVNHHALKFMERSQQEGKAFFLWWNSTRMHFRTHVSDQDKGKSGQWDYNDAMVAHDEQVGELLNKLDELAIAENTIVLYSTDNGPHFNTWPDASITRFRSEKNTNWEWAYRVPAFVRWPGRIGANKFLNGIVSYQDWLPTLLAAAGDSGSIKAINECEPWIVGAGLERFFLANSAVMTRFEPLREFFVTVMIGSKTWDFAPFVEARFQTLITNAVWRSSKRHLNRSYKKLTPYLRRLSPFCFPRKQKTFY
jgi:arylsulfatase A-like enzyme